MALEFPAHPFWDFSLQVYLTDGVPPACVVLQDRHGIDVNVLLFCMWVGASGRGTLSDDEMAGTLGAVTDWNRDIVCALREIRRRLKGGMPPAPEALSEPLRARIQKIEVDIEHVEQLMLAGTVDRRADPDIGMEERAGHAGENIAAYLRAIGVSLDDGDRESLAVPLRVAFARLASARIETLCASLP